MVKPVPSHREPHHHHNNPYIARKVLDGRQWLGIARWQQQKQVHIHCNRTIIMDIGCRTSQLHTLAMARQDQAALIKWFRTQRFTDHIFEIHNIYYIYIYYRVVLLGCREQEQTHPDSISKLMLMHVFGIYMPHHTTLSFVIVCCSRYTKHVLTHYTHTSHVLRCPFLLDHGCCALHV